MTTEESERAAGGGVDFRVSDLRHEQAGERDKFTGAGISDQPEERNTGLTIGGCTCACGKVLRTLRHAKCESGAGQPLDMIFRGDKFLQFLAGGPDAPVQPRAIFSGSL